MTQQEKVILYISELPWQIQLIWSLCVFFLSLFVFFFVFLITSRIVKNKKENKAKKIEKVIEGLLSEILFDDDYESLIQASDKTGLKNKVGLPFLKDKMSAKLFYQEIIRLHNNYKGELAEKMEAVFRLLDFDELCMKKIKSTKWFVTAEGILEANEMALVEFLPVIFPLANNEENAVRTAAQNAIIQLNQEAPFSFFDTITYPLSEWDQIQLHQALRKYQNQNIPSMKKRLSNPEDTVVEFALKLINEYKQEEAFDEVVKCLNRPSKIVQKAALNAVISIDNENSLAAVAEWMKKITADTSLFRIAIDYLATQDFDPEKHPFLHSYIEHPNISISVQTIEMLAKSPSRLPMLYNYIKVPDENKPQELVTKIIDTYN